MSDNQPKYLSLIKWIEEQVYSNKFSAGDKFYSENELCKRFDLSRQTVRQAVGTLVDSHVLERRRGSGTYIASGNIRQKRSNSIGLISTYLDSYIFPNIIRGIDKVLSKQGYALQLNLTHNKIENEQRALQNLLKSDIDGIIVEPTKSGLPNPNVGLYQEIRARKIPLIFFNAYYPLLEHDFHYIAMDDYIAGNMATQYLINHGHTKIAGIFQADDRQGHLRYSGYIQALKDASLTHRSSNILWFATEDISDFDKDISRIKRCINGCTAVVCYNDQIAYKLFQTFKVLGISVPNDVSIVGIDNSEYANLSELLLTSVAHPNEELGKKVGENIIKLINNPDFDATYKFKPVMVKRKSVKKI